MSLGHPPLEELPLPPEHLQRAWQQRAVQRDSGEAKSMQVLESYDIMRENTDHIRDEDDLWGMARDRQESGDRKATACFDFRFGVFWNLGCLRSSAPTEL